VRINSRNFSIALVACAIAALALVAGASARSGITEASSQKLLKYPNVVTTTAACQGSRHVVSGGFTLDTAPGGSGPYGFPRGLYPTGQDIDKVAFRAYNRSAIYDGHMKSLAYCASGPKPVLRKGGADIPGFDGAPHQASAQCPKGKVVIGGGWDLDGPTAGSGVVAVTDMFRDNPRTLTIGVFNERAEAVELTVYVLCDKGKAPVEQPMPANVKPFKSKSITAECPGDRKVLFGGFNTEYNDFESIASFIKGLERPAPDKVKVTVFNNGVASEDTAAFRALAYCR
jgi:hypothetical protein